MKYDNQLRYAVNIVRAYDGSIPLAAWLKDFFRQHKQMGSRDRKTVATMVYSFFRLGQLAYSSIESRIITALGQCHQLPEITAYLEWQYANENPGKIITRPDPQQLLQEVFPWRHELSEGIDADSFVQSFFVQPDLFLRPRPAKQQEVESRLQQAGIPYTVEPPDAIRLANNTRLEEILTIDTDAVIQDLNSQRTAGLLNGIHNQLPDKPRVWDCCAASGGKSMMINDLLPDIDLTVSDIRPSILQNLARRFAAAGITHYRSRVSDLAGENTGVPQQAFDLVIADAPCSGSGTWARTPEQLFFYKPEKTLYYQQLQKKILMNVLPSLAQGGFLLYITCSVFKKENEEVVEHLLQHSTLRLVEKKLLAGYDKKADTLFAALFTG